MLYPLTFHPRFKERVWGGRSLETLYGKALPVGVPIGESWEISDRPGDESVIAEGALAGKNLRWLMEHHREELLGSAPTSDERFPLLVKILDAREKLSLQVHPPAAKAKELGGEPKTEMWYVADAEPGAVLYAGLRKGVTRDEFSRKIAAGSVEDCFHRLHVAAGDAMFLPSGRVHAIGAGLVIFEVQQNSDTTYRVHDWNRVGLDGKPRSLHIKESLESIDFEDFEPGLAPGSALSADAARPRLLVRDPLFSVEAHRVTRGAEKRLPDDRMQIIGVISGEVLAQSQARKLALRPGQFCLVPASLTGVSISSLGDMATFLRVEAGTR